MCPPPHTHTLEYYSAIKKNEIMPFTATWMDPEIITLGEVNQTKKDKHQTIWIIKYYMEYKILYE